MIFSSRVSGLISILALAVLGTACSKSQPNSERKPTADILSNRPIGVVPELFVVTLQEPALLASARPTPAGLEITAEAKAKVLDEQAQFETKLKNVVPQAQIIYRYRLTLNGFAVYAPADSAAAIHGLAGVSTMAPVRQMARPEAFATGPTPLLTSSTNSVTFIGGDRARDLGFTGKNIRVGVLDTGVDYTHSMLGGSGNKADYTAVDPSQPNAQFPNAKVVGGLDLVGSDFNAASPFAKDHLPRPDGNPLDESGHGTHVAGTIAGLGDGRKTYSGVAPDAVIYGLKVFGKKGSTMDAVVIAGYEFAADPNQDLDIQDRLDVINLSLGGGFGQPQILYTEAARNLTRGGTMIVASAGNSGPVDYIVGAPSTSDDALSVAASIDGSIHNWQFRASKFSSAGGDWLAKAVEGPISKSVEDIATTTGPLVFIGLADKDLTEEEKARLNGKVALIMRGKVSFAEKLKRAVDSGAIGAVVVNNEAGNRAFAMGGDGHVDIPAIMVGNEMGTKIIQELASNEVTIDFKTPEKIFEPELIDTITDFSSKGPRSEDNLFKPEIAAPGANIISAAMGQGKAGTKMSGTSMAGPHMAGVMAVLRQARPQLTPQELKSLVMNTAKVLPNIPLTLQGAGRVQLDKALEARVITVPHALSLGRVQVGTSRKLSHTLTVKNLSNKDLQLTTGVEATRGLNFSLPAQLILPANSEVPVQVESEVTMSPGAEFAAELDGRLFFLEQGQVAGHTAALAIATQASLIQGQRPGVDRLTLTNSSPLAGLALAFNLIGEDARKAEASPNEAWKSRSCDLQSAGYRIVTKPGQNNVPTEYLQIAFKLHTPLTTWVSCDVSALFDADGDGVAEQELTGAHGGGLPGIGVNRTASLLIDAKKARDVRMAYETAVANGQAGAEMNYKPALLAVQPMADFPHSTVAMVEAPLALIARGADGQIHLKLAAQDGGYSIEADDYLGRWGLGEWKTIASSAAAQAFDKLPEELRLEGHRQEALTYQRGTGVEPLVIYYPNNELVVNGRENQSQIF